MVSETNIFVLGLDEANLRSCFIGTRDVLLADSRNLYHEAKEQGVPLEYWEYGGMFHAWMIANIPEAKHALDRIAELVTR